MQASPQRQSLPQQHPWLIVVVVRVMVQVQCIVVVVCCCQDSDQFMASWCMHDCRSSFFDIALVLILLALNGWCKNSNHQSFVVAYHHTDVLKHYVVRRVRFLSEYNPAIGWPLVLVLVSHCRNSVLGCRTNNLGFALGCLSSTFALKYLCPSPATLNARAWNPWLVGHVELGTSATPQKSQLCALGLNSQIAGSFFYILLLY
jgi:hypothetical protein